MGTSGSGVLAGARGRAGAGTLGRGPSRVAARVAVRPVKFVGREWMGGSDSPRQPAAVGLPRCWLVDLTSGLCGREAVGVEMGSAREAASW